jgi:proteasome lid subunit RPN8/RPN11
VTTYDLGTARGRIEVESPDDQRHWTSVPCTLPESTQVYLIGKASASTDEICGFITRGGSVIPVPNVDPEPSTGFKMDVQTMVGVLADHEIVGVYHSHPSGRAWPSSCDTNKSGYLYAQGCPWDYYIVTDHGVHRYEHKDRSA